MTGNEVTSEHPLHYSTVPTFRRLTLVFCDT
uniref:Uncharacterized protein n=1 Tax=Anguilla anguilla TaxID=7936 RepID=A0A0E9SWB1_ANGAN